MEIEIFERVLKRRGRDFKVMKFWKNIWDIIILNNFVKIKEIKQNLKNKKVFIYVKKKTWLPFCKNRFN